MISAGPGEGPKAQLLRGAAGTKRQPEACPSCYPAQVKSSLSTPGSRLPSRPRPGLLLTCLSTKPVPWDSRDLMNCRVAKAAFDPSSSAEEIDTLNGENLGCDVEVWDGPCDHVTACSPAVEDAEWAQQDAVPPKAHLPGLSPPGSQEVLAGTDIEWPRDRSNKWHSRTSELQLDAVALADSTRLSIEPGKPM
ncbi:hypothetical protein P7K49_020966 [Saguinus oedipus]|uniref:Uncharacterized protein n=1 Tax=Saguinus oedipus TaxID=9490 RepID=A0ABQ9URB0_SAGOE|nr:hypothetical protein P7K49_020966 [Saguinus oedipus]